MGLKFFSNGPEICYSCNPVGPTSSPKPKASPAPDGLPRPYRYTIKEMKRLGGFIVAWLNYPDCTNYGGDKIVLYSLQDWFDATTENKLDPHFLKDAPSPLARFEPTRRGLELAFQTAELLSGEER